MVALTKLERGITTFAVLAGIADAAIALAATHGKVDTRVGTKIGADVAALGAIGAGHWMSSREIVIPIGYGGPPTGASSVRLIQPMVLLFLVADIITGLEQLNGFGSPDTGGKFTEGASKFYNNGNNDVYGILKSASVDRSRWNGDAADRYDAANTALKTSIDPLFAVQMVALDNRMAEILARQADQVQTVGQGLAGARLTVMGAISVVAAMIATSCPAQSWIGVPLLKALQDYANQIAEAVGATAVGLLTALLVQADQNAHDVDRASDQYDALAKTANGILAGSMRVPAALRVPAASGSAGSSFADISYVRSGTGGRVAVGAVNGAGSGDASPTPRSPAHSALIQLSGQAAKLSQQASQAMNVVDQAMGQVQQLTSSAQAVPARGAPGKEVAAAGAVPAGDPLAQDVAAAAAAPGASAQGVPVEVVTAGVEHNQDPTRVQRAV